MPSPFPGMNPYLEQEDVWQDFHHSLITAVREAVGTQVLPTYLVKIEERIYIHELPARERHFVGRSDVAVSRAPRPSRGGAAVIEAPARGRIPSAVDVERQAYLEVRDRRSRELVTVIEVLSPSNKQSGPDREQYLTKRRQLLFSPAHLVEIDLLRGGPRLPVEDMPPCDYAILVSRAEDRPEVGIWPVGLRDRLPVVPIPLRTPDPDARLDLQEVLHRIYDAAGYENYIYLGDPQPALAPEDAAWAACFLPGGAAQG